MKRSVQDLSRSPNAVAVINTIYPREYEGPMIKITFLGTGGGRHTTMFQARSTGGLLMETGMSRIHLDPGPGALTNMCRIGYDLRMTDAVIISHCHPDHYSDAQVVIEGMTYGGWKKRGEVYGSVSVMEGKGGLGPMMSDYHMNLAQRVFTVRPGERYDIAGLPTETTRSEHSDPTTVGFRFDTGHGVLSYISDTSFSESIAEQYRGSRVLLLPITTPSGNRIKGHLCTDDAIPFLHIVRPEVCVFTHLGIVMLKHNPLEQAKTVEDATGVRTIVGEDLMTMDIDDDIIFGKLTPRIPEWNDAWDL